MPRILLCLAVILSVCAVAAAAAEYRLTILHTNDFHARFAPVTGSDAPCAAADDAAGACFGGSARLATAIRAARARAGDVLLLDAGDQFQGSLFYSRYKGRLAAEMMTALGYDAMAVGNHEFDDGPGVLRAFADRVAFPVLMSNAVTAAEPVLAEVILPSAVVERGGARLGLIGIAPEDTAEMSSPGPGIRFTDPVAAVRREVARLEAGGIDKIIVLSHSGYGVDRRIARRTRGVDVIVGGHSHSYLANDDPAAEGPYPTMVGRTAIVQAGAHGRVLGELRVTFDAAGRVLRAEGAPIVMDAGVPADPEIAARVARAAAPLAEIRNRVVGRAAGAIAGGHGACRARECEMGNLVADAMLAHVRGQGIDAAIQNGGGLRAGIDKGEVTMGEVMAVLPFSNTLSTFRLRGAALRAALENGVSGVAGTAGRFPQVAGLRFAYDPEAPPGARIREVTVGGAPLDPERMYGVVSNSFLRGGGDGYTMLREAEDAYDFGPLLADVVAEYLAARGPYAPYTDGRIRAETSP